MSSQSLILGARSPKNIQALQYFLVLFSTLMQFENIHLFGKWVQISVCSPLKSMGFFFHFLFLRSSLPLQWLYSNPIPKGFKYYGSVSGMINWEFALLICTVSSAGFSFMSQNYITCQSSLDPFLNEVQSTFLLIQNFISYSVYFGSTKCIPNAVFVISTDFTFI